MSLFISFEGVEGSGKSTQVHLLNNYLIDKGFKTLLTKEPGGTEAGEKIREILLENKFKLAPYTELFLYLASRSQNTIYTIIPALESNKIVIADRYSESTIAYQVAGRGLPEKIINEVNALATKGLSPDVTFLLDFDPEIGLQRIGYKKDRIERENIDFHLKVRAAYKKLSRQYPDRIYMVDASRPPEKIHQIIINKISNLLPQLKGNKQNNHAHK
ncbi:MAG: hypothetical protein APR63_02655 [Desulfuromonas sp. SDB]|nr:MAG: hypothetical protein APR63_02655 [Desulfuromonas sp. SDB]